jgi:hypothetical protein
MARKKKDLMNGAPQDGDPFDPVDEVPGPDDEGDPDVQQPQAPDPDTNLSPSELINKRFDALQQEFRVALNARPAAPSPQPPEPPPAAEPDWDKLIFDKPAETLKLYGDKIKREVTQELTKRYQTETGYREFWSDFYQKNPDLSNDSDLVQTTMNKHLAELADLTVPQASARLAELTRTRILGYAGMNGRKPAPRSNGRTAIEGAAPPVAKPNTPVTPKGPTTLGDLLRNRRANRSRAIGA